MNAARDLIEKKLSHFEFTLMLSMTMAVGAIAIDMMLPAMGDIREKFGLAEGSNEVAAIVTFFFLGLAAGQLVWGTISDALGRKKVLYMGLAVYISAAIAGAMAPTLGVLLLVRFVWGFGAAGARTVVQAIVRDTYVGTAMARAMSFILAVFVLVPIFAPTLGSAVLLIGPWEWIFLTMALFGAGLAAWTIRMPETHPVADRIPFRIGRILKASRFVISNPMTVGYTMAQALIFGFFISYLASSQLIIEDIFGLEAWFPLIFGGTAVVMGVAMLANTRLLKRVPLRPLISSVFTFHVVASLVLGATMLVTDGHPPFALFMVTLLAVLMGHSLLVPNLNAIAMIPMGPVAGTAAAVIGTTVTLIGAVIGATIDRLYDGSLVYFGLGAAVTGVVGYGFMRWGDRAEARTEV
ncbi:MAG: multidrug effflux MFS transporter [Acidimicrobiia bacterium]|nr:multidrug effflux MFS transporter [Acidimicrobiia bacterium]